MTAEQNPMNPSWACLSVRPQDPRKAFKWPDRLRLASASCKMCELCRHTEACTASTPTGQINKNGAQQNVSLAARFKERQVRSVRKSAINSEFGPLMRGRCTPAPAADSEQKLYRRSGGIRSSSLPRVTQPRSCNDNDSLASRSPC